MKTMHNSQFTMYNWLRTLALLVFSSLCIVNIPAQEAQDALYIFRNDGQFNAFFFDDIDRFEYSCVDTLGVEHPDYVVQEIYALDTLFRIPLSAIDSISFVTPETKYKPGVVIADKRLVDYITASDSLYWIQLAANTPREIMPKVGDKLIIEEDCQYLPYGFGGLVTSVESVAGGFKVMTKAMEITDVYEHAVIKASCSSSPDESASRRKLILDGEEFGSDEVFNLGPINQKIIAQGSQNVIEVLDGNLSAGLTSKGEINIELKPRLTMRFFAFIDPLSHYQIDQFLKFDVKTKVDVSINGGINGHLDIPLLKAPGIFNKKKVKIDASIGYFLDGTGETYYKGSYSGRFEAGAFSLRRKEIGEEQCKIDRKGMKYTHGDWSSEGGCGDVTFKCGYYAKAELTLPFEKDTTITGGIRVEGGLQVAVTGAMLYSLVPSDLMQTYYDGLYNALNVDDNIRTNLYVGLQVYSKKNWNQINYIDESAPFFKLKIGAVPNIHELRYLIPGFDQSQLHLTAFLDRACINTPVGFAIFNNDNSELLDLYWYPQYYGVMVDWQRYGYIYTMDPDRNFTQRYRVFPAIRYFGKPILVDQPQTVENPPAYVHVDKEVSFGEDIETKELDLTSNIPDLTFTPDADWLDAFFYRERDEQSPILSSSTLSLVNDAMPDGVNQRDCKVHIVGKTTKGVVVFEDDIKVTQTRAAMVLNPGVLRFGKDGGTATSTIVSTTMTNLSLRVSEGDTWARAQLNGNVITVTVEKNTWENDRTAIVYIKGKTLLGDEGEVEITVIQEGTGGAGPEPQPGDELGIQFLWMQPVFEYTSNVTKEEDDYANGYDWMGNATFYASDGSFTGLNVTEEDINNHLFSVSTTIIDDNKIHVTCQGGPKQYYQSVATPVCDGCPEPSWMSKHTLSFDIVKGTDISEWTGQPYKYYTLENVTMTEDGEWIEDEYNGSTKSGFISFSPTFSETQGSLHGLTPEHGFLNPGDDETGPYYDWPGNGPLNSLGVSHGETNLNVTSYSYRWDGHRTESEWDSGDEEESNRRVYNKHAVYSYKQSNNESINFRIIFKNSEKFKEWMDK